MVERHVFGTLPSGETVEEVILRGGGLEASVLTYGAVIELNLDLSKPAPPLAEWRKGETWQVLRPPQLQQQEAIAWQPDERAFVYDTETGRSHGPATLMKVACEVP